MSLCAESKILGVTATPWRGDSADVIQHFGGASFKLGIEEGMRLGYLCDVRYRVFVDDIKWDFVRSISQNRYSIRELNSSLFIPQRDEKIRDELLTVWNQTPNPRAIVFCQTIEHARRMQEILSAVPQWRNAQSIHNEVNRRDRQIHLMNFRRGVVPLLVAVDVLNEGVDVPDVNIVCFARVTHSRRIFVQQVGRGLRLSHGKEFVSVLDFVSDLKRVAEVLHLRKSVSQDVEDVFLPSSHSITFEDKRVESLMTEWLLDVADIELAADNARFNFPEFLG
jgi:superfamily II DNA or RNA helicase